MTSDQYARLKDIVAGALSERDEHRSAYLQVRCGADAAMFLEAESWLAAAVEAERLYESPTLLIAGNDLTFEVLEGVDATAEDDIAILVVERTA